MDFGPGSNACPICHMTDQTQPVPGIVTSQTSHSSAYVRGYRAHGWSSTSLAQLLDLPRPRAPRGMVTAGVILTAIGVPLGGLFLLVSMAARHSETNSAPAWASVMAPLWMTIPVWGPGLVSLVVGFARMRG